MIKLNWCYYANNNSKELKMIKEFETNYLSAYALWWYTRNSFLYKMLNKALRVQNIHLLYLFRFFMRHIETEVKCTMKYQFVFIVHN